jgi:hypothetical protein
MELVVEGHLDTIKRKKVRNEYSGQDVVHNSGSTNQSNKN